MSTFDFLAFPVRGLVTLAILFIFFLAIYAVLPFRRLSVKSQTPGAAFAAVGWALFSTAFSIYFRYFKNFTVTYGSLAAVILMMLWLYFCICIPVSYTHLDVYKRQPSNSSRKLAWVPVVPLEPNIFMEEIT